MTLAARARSRDTHPPAPGMVDSPEFPDPAPSRTGRIVTVAVLIVFATGPILWFAGLRTRSPSTPPWPAWELHAFLDGGYTEDLQRHLEESSPLTATLRGLHRDASFLLGLDTDAGYVAGRGGFWFVRGSLSPGATATTGRAARTTFFASVATWCQERGVRLLAVPVPDKRRVYPDRLPQSHRAAPTLASRYRELLDELDAAGIASVDLATAMARWRTERLAEPLFAARDSHWTFEGTVRVAEHVADELRRRGWLADAPRTPLAAGPVQRLPAATDLVRAAGFLPGGTVEKLVTEALVVGDVRVPEDAPAPVLALAGDSFSGRNLPTTLTAALGTPLDDDGAIPAKGPGPGLVDTMGRIDRGELDATTIVWVFVERAMASEFGWTPLPPGP